MRFGFPFTVFCEFRSTMERGSENDCGQMQNMKTTLKNLITTFDVWGIQKNKRKQSFYKSIIYKTKYHEKVVALLSKDFTKLFQRYFSRNFHPETTEFRIKNTRCFQEAFACPSVANLGNYIFPGQFQAKHASFSLNFW